MKWLFALLFIVAGVVYFADAEFFAGIIPSYLPYHLALVYVSGICEIALGVLLLIPKCTRLAAWGLVALLIAVFPANINMALHAEQFPQIADVALWIRLPIQGVLIAWAFWFTRPPAKAACIGHWPKESGISF